MSNKLNYTWVPVIHFQTAKSFYTEFRYNYEEPGAASVYAGKTFNIEGKIKSSFTPAAGIVIGKYTGASMALNTGLSYERFFFYTQSQYTFCADNKKNDFFYNWSDLFYQQLDWLYTGVTLQQTKYCREGIKTEAGLLVGFTKNNWTIPVYFLNPLSAEQYFIIGINVEWGKIDKN